LDVQGPSCLSPSKYQATGAILVVRVFLNDLPREEGFTRLRIHNTAFGHLAYSVVCKEQSVGLRDLLNGLYIHNVTL